MITYTLTDSEVGVGASKDGAIRILEV